MVELTNEVYWAHFPPEIVALKDIPVSENRTRKAFELVAKGAVLDPQIIIFNVDPVAAHKSRVMQGLVWVPALGQTVDNAQWNPLNVIEKIPSGAIKTSIDAADYPPFAPPPPTEPAKQGPSFFAWGNYWYGQLGAVLATGQKWEDERGKFVVVELGNPVAPSRMWEKVA